MERIDLTADSSVPAAARLVGSALATDGVVVIPTETFYGLAANPASEAAVARVAELKQRPTGQPLPVVCADWRQIESLVEVPDAHRVRLSRSWPGALTVVARARRPLPAGRDGTLAVRIPALARLRAVLYLVGPVTATSANRHGAAPCRTADEALASLAGAPDLVLDAGTTEGRVASTLVDLTVEPARVLRPGPVGWI
jgi:L-threonylcarbamoyladenylate synthase